MALSLDIISHYIFEKYFGLVEQPGFSPLRKDVVTMTMESFTLRNLPWLPDLLKALSQPLTRRIDRGLAFYLHMEQVYIHFILF